MEEQFVFVDNISKRKHVYGKSSGPNTDPCGTPHCYI